MQTKGKINVVDYDKPGSKELFDKFSSSIEFDVNSYILKNHGIIVATQNPLRTFGIIEEFEQSAKIAICSKKYLNLSEIKY